MPHIETKPPPERAVSARLGVHLTANGRSAAIAVWFIAMALVGIYGSSQAGPAALLALTLGGVLILGSLRSSKEPPRR